jgi:hypothetical protein
MVYVLTTKMAKDAGGEWRPIAVVEDQHTADEWVKVSKNNDWIGFEMNDLSLTDMAEGSPLVFHPPPVTPIEEQGKRIAESLQQTNAQLIGIIEQLATRYQDKNVLKVVKGLRTEGRIASKRAASDWGEGTLRTEGYEGEELEAEKDRRWRLSHAPDCDVRSGFMSCTCKLDRFGPHSSGCKECGCKWDQPHESGCKRMMQENLFTSDLLKKQ